MVNANESKYPFSWLSTPEKTCIGCGIAVIGTLFLVLLMVILANSKATRNEIMKLGKQTDRQAPPATRAAADPLKAEKVDNPLETGKVDNSLVTGEPLPVSEQEAKDAVLAYIEERDKRESNRSENDRRELDRKFQELKGQQTRFGLYFKSGELKYDKQIGRDLSVGAVAYLYRPTISNITGPRVAYVRFGHMLAIAIGWPTSGKVDGEYLVEKVGAIVISTANYEDTEGVIRNVYVIQPFDLDGWLKKMGQNE